MTDDAWHFAVKRYADGWFLAWCAKTPNLGDGPLEVDFAEEVHFEFAKTAEGALKKLREEVLN